MTTLNVNYQQTLPGTPTAPSTDSVFAPDVAYMEALRREIWTDPVEEPLISTEMTSAHSFFRGNDVLRVNELTRYQQYGQVLTVPVIKDQNLFSLYESKTIDYKDVDDNDCLEEMKFTCDMPCINTLPEIEKLEIRFDTEYTYGVRACDKDRQFWDYGFFTRQYALSREGKDFGREVDLWNKVMTGLRTSPATTVDAYVADKHPTHFWNNLGNIDVNRNEIMEAYQYMVDAYTVDPTVFMTREAATAIVDSVQNPYNINLSQTIVNTFEKWDIPGYELAANVARILSLADNKVVVMKRSPWMTTAGFNRFPLWNADRSKQYVAILDPRVAYNIAIDGYHLNIMPYDCDKLVRGMVDSEYTATGITFPQYGMVLEFDGPSHEVTPVTGLSFGAATAEITAGETEVFEVTVTPEGATAPIQYISNNTEVATVTAASEGTGAAVTAIAEGVASISAIASGKVATITITVEAV